MVDTRRVSRRGGVRFATDPASTRHTTLARGGFAGYLIDSSSKLKTRNKPGTAQ